MSVTKTLRTPVDTWIIQDSPNLTRVLSHVLRVDGNTTAGRRSFIFFPNLALSARYTVESAILYLYADGAIGGGPHVFTCRRITSRWKAQPLNWNNQPTVTTTHQDQTTVATSLADGGELQFDLTDMLNDVASGNVYYGFRITVDTAGHIDFHSAQSIKPQMKPRLVVTYSYQPEPPTDLRPSGSLAIGSQQPTLAWSADVNQLQFQVQISSDGSSKANFVAAIVHDSGATTDERQLYRLSETGFSLPSGGTMRFWRVRVKNQAGIWSDYSDIVGMYYASLGTLTITNPSSGTPVVEETTPPIDWTFSGRTQQAYRLTLYDQNQVDEDGLTSGWGDDWGRRWGGSGMQEIWTSGWQQSAATVAHVPPHLIKRLNNAYYGVKVEVNDTIDRTSCPGTPAIVEQFRIFTFQEVTAISTVASLTVSNPEGWYLQLDWVDTVEPDYYGIKVDGEYIHDRETPSKYHTSGTNYRKKFYGMRPLRNSTFEVVRIVQDGGAGQPYRHSKNNPTQTTRFVPLGIWVADEETDTAVNVGRGDDAASLDLAVVEGNTVYRPLGRRDAVRVVDFIGGLEGTVSGLIRGLSDKELFEKFKAQLPSKQFRLITGDLSIRFRMGEVTKLAPTGDPIRGNVVADKLWDVTFEVFQSDDWTFRARY